MAFPVNLHAFGITINSHLILEDLGMIVGFRLYLFTRKRSTDKISTANRIWIFCGAGFGALLISRLLGDLEKPDIFFNSHTPLKYYLSNQTIIGGLLGGLMGTEIVKKIIGEKSSSGDLLAIPLIIAICIGRVGCFLSGLEDETYGIATSLPWGINLGDGIRRHPTALYEIAFLLTLGIILFWIKRTKTLKNGALFKMFLVPYLLFRFFIEFIKPYYFFSFGLTVLQLACLAGLVYYYRFFIQSPFAENEGDIPDIEPQSLIEQTKTI